jgi:hypothetical protein
MTRLNILSKRGLEAGKKPMRVDLEVYNQAIENQYDALKNPKGAFPMNVAENHLCWEMFREKIQSITTRKRHPGLGIQLWRPCRCFVLPRSYCQVFIKIFDP